ncbi:MAG: hypothetical protein MPJ50_00630 [Pirellulales bacterium]|nr:hypothetical protein [Pirellulales bacterium]
MPVLSVPLWQLGEARKDTPPLRNSPCLDLFPGRILYDEPVALAIDDLRPMRALRHLYLAYLAKPAEDRILYRTLRQHRCQSIVEIGIGCIERTERLLRMAAERNDSPPRYAAIDQFDMREESPLPLRKTFTRLRSQAKNVRLLPGDPNAVLRQSANDLLGADLLLFTADAFASMRADGWFFIPRMLKDGTTAGVEEKAGDSKNKKRSSVAKQQPAEVTRIFVAIPDKDGKPGHRAVSVDEVQRLASAGSARRVAA